MADPAEILKKLDAIEGRQTGVSARDVLSRLDEIEGRASGEVLRVTENGGRVMRSQDGTVSYSDDVWSTNNPQLVQRILDGEKPADVAMSSWDQSTIAQAPVTARLQEAVRGIPFVGSYIDELAGAVKGEGAQQNSRALTSAMQRENPGETMALNVGGAVTGSAPIALAAAPAVSAAAPASRVGQVAMAGVGGGAVGAAEGATYQYGEDRDAKTGAIVGGGLGAALGIAAPYASQGIQNLAEWFKKSDVALIAGELGLSREAATVIRNAFRSGDRGAAEDAVSAAGDRAMLADAGQPARELLDASAAAGGEAGAIARQAVDARAAGAAIELNKALDDALGVPVGQRTGNAQIRSSTRSSRSQAYDAAYSQPIDYSRANGRYIEGLMKRVPKSAIDKANALMRVNGEESAQIIAKVADDGSVSFETLPDVRQLHYIMQALDDVAEGAKGVMGRNTTESRAFENLRGQISNTLKREVPEFANAQAIAADSIRQEKALDAGYKLLTPGFRREDAFEALKDASEAERAAMAQGVRSYIDDTLANVRRTITDPNVDARQAMQAVQTLSSNANRTKLTRLLGREKAERLFEAIDRETVSLELRAAIATNSKTAIRQSIQEGVKDQTQPGIVRTLAQGEGVNATKRFIQAMTGETPEAVQLRQMGLFEEIATVLTQTRGDGARRALQTINNAIAGQPIKDAEAAQVARVVTIASGLSANREGQRALTPQSRAIAAQ